MCSTHSTRSLRQPAKYSDLGRSTAAERSRKVSISKDARAISVSRSTAQVRTTTQSVVSIHSISPPPSVSTAATSLSTASGSAVALDALRALDRPASTPGAAYTLLSTLAYYTPYPFKASAHQPTVRPRIPAHHSVGRRRTRANYSLDANSKLAPFPGSARLALPPPLAGSGRGPMLQDPPTEEWVDED